MAADAKHAARQLALARILLSIRGMRWLLAILLCSECAARAVEVRSELTASREFAFFVTELDVELAGGRLGLGGGFTLVSDYRQPRYGGQLSIEYRGERVTAGVAGAFGPRQERRGWASLDPHAAFHLDGARWKLDGEAGLLLRRVDGGALRTAVSIDQLQLHAELRGELDERWQAALFALLSFYDPDLARPSLRGADLGLAVSLAGRPERWAVGVRAARQLVDWLRVELTLAGVAYADGHGGALAPRVAARGGPWKGFSVEASLELVTGIAEAAADPLHEIGGVALGFER